MQTKDAAWKFHSLYNSIDAVTYFGAVIDMHVHDVCGNDRVVCIPVCYYTLYPLCLSSLAWSTSVSAAPTFQKVTSTRGCRHRVRLVNRRSGYCPLATTLIYFKYTTRCVVSGLLEGKFPVSLKYCKLLNSLFLRMCACTAVCTARHVLTVVCSSTASTCIQAARCIAIGEVHPKMKINFVSHSVCGA